MGMVSELVKELREHGQIHKHNNRHTADLLNQAADTIESLSAKLQAADKESEDAKEVIGKLLCSEYGSSCQFCIHNEDNDAMCCNVGGSGSWCCENAKWNGKTL